jgi:hypothetical protein
MLQVRKIQTTQILCVKKNLFEKGKEKIMGKIDWHECKG